MMHLHINDILKSLNMILFIEEQSEKLNDLHTCMHTVSAGLEDGSFLYTAIFCLSFGETLSMKQIP